MKDDIGYFSLFFFLLCVLALQVGIAFQVWGLIGFAVLGIFGVYIYLEGKKVT